MLNLIAMWRREREIIRRLSKLSDRELDDVGIPRWDIRSTVRHAPAVTSAVSDARFGTSDPLETMAPAWASQNRRALTA